MATRISYEGTTARVIRRCFWLLWADGMAIGSWMFFRSASPSSYILAHEFSHCQMYQVMGLWRFLWTYITDAEFRRMEEARAHDWALANRDKYVFVKAAQIFSGK